MLQDLAPADAGKVKADAKLRLVTTPGLGYATIAFNLGNGAAADNPMGRNAKVRAAFEAAIDRNVINQVALEGLFVPNNQTELPTSPYFNKAFPVPGRDVAKARALLQGRAHVTVEDIQALAAPTLRHRILLNYRAEAEGIRVEEVIKRLLAGTKTPVSA